MRVFSFCLFLLYPSALFAGAAEDMARLIHQSTLDPQQCYRVRDLRLERDEVKLYFTEGFLIFGKPVNGTIVSAAFAAETEGGDGELLLMPPFPRERQSLAQFTKSPNMNEHFRHGVLLFTDNSGAELMSMMQTSGSKKSAEMGTVLAERMNSLVASLQSSFEVRLVEDLLSPRRESMGFLFGAFNGNVVGNFDVLHDPRSLHQITVGQVAFRNDRRYFDVWTNFAGRGWRNGVKQTPAREYKIDRFFINATIEPDLTMKVVTKLRVTPVQSLRVFTLDLSQQMHVTKAIVDGSPGEAFSPESLRANLIRGNENNLLLVTGDHEFPAGKPIELELHHEGTTVTPAGNGVFFVGARGLWYPNRGQQFADYEVVFKFPKNLDLVATGDLVEEQVEGDWKISRRKTSSPVRLFGFNLGNYERTTIKRGGLTVEVCANRKLETALVPRPRPTEMNPIPPPPFSRQRRVTPDIVMVPQPAPNPAARLELLAQEFSSVFEDMTARFGPSPVKTLTVSPIPGRFGQGFPGLVYLSTMAYLNPEDRPIGRANGMQQVFFSEILHAHEIAHQWWGNGITAGDYQDDWLMEALANYSALWTVERKKGGKILDSILDQYRNDLLHKEHDGRPIESAGPVTMGHRLYSSQFPNSWAVITYEKGAWILHMLRKRMGDDRFQKMLFQLYQRNLNQPVTTEKFRQTAVEFLPPQSPDPKLENFFEQWVNGTGIPELKMSYSVSGKAPKFKVTGTITQTGVDETFGILVPVEIQIPRMKPIVKWVATSSEPVTFAVDVPAAPLKVLLDPSNSILMRK